MIDKDLFPDEYNAIERLKARSRQYEKETSIRRNNKLKKIEECRRLLHEKHSQQ